ncbi:MAG: response regulator [Anaerolineales bacterium]|nr:response regulator [Anaerolineales bacterium]
MSKVGSGRLKMNLSAPHILIVDDDPAIRRLIELILRKGGYRYSLAANGLRAIELMEADPPDVVICDLTMPEMDGFQLLLMMKEAPTLAHIPVIILTAGGQQHQVEHVLEHGAAACLFKPFSIHEFLSTIRKALDAAAHEPRAD